MEIGACNKIDVEELIKITTCSEDETPDFYNFLSKFKYLDKIRWNEELVRNKIQFVCSRINEEDCDAVFMDFSVSKYRHIGWSLKESITFILDRFAEFSNKHIIPILSIKYESPFDVQHKISKIVESDISDRICGIDFVGDEAKFNIKYQKYICDMWSDKFIRLHVGESKSQDNIRDTIDNINVTNIAHGIKIVDEELISNAIDKDIYFDIAPTSNYLTGVIPKSSIHPGISMMNKGVRITVGSDDPSILNTTLTREYEILKSQGAGDGDILKMRKNSKDMMDRWLRYSTKNIS